MQDQRYFAAIERIEETLITENNDELTALRHLLILFTCH